MEEFREIDIKEIPYNKGLKDAMAQVPKGAFLTVKNGDEINTMTIGWATSGVMWARPVFVIGVRPSRYTYQFMDLNSEFTVSVPLNQQLKKALGYCGSHSGREVDKFEEADITAVKGLVASTPAIKECGLHFECKVVAKHQLMPEFMDETIKSRYYPEDDYHMIFYGEILKCYKVL